MVESLYFGEATPYASEWCFNTKITWDRKCKNRFFLRISSQKWINLRQTNTKMMISSFYTYCQIHFISRNALFHDILLKLAGHLAEHIVVGNFSTCCHWMVSACHWPMSRLEIVLHIQDGGTLVVSFLDDLRDFNQPHVPGSSDVALFFDVFVINHYWASSCWQEIALLTFTTVWMESGLTLWRPLLSYKATIKRPVPDRVKPPFVIYNIRVLADA